MSLHFLALLLPATRALPAGSFNETIATTSAEASCSDNHRTLWNIISTCLLTTFACVYTSIHPNVPSPYDGPLAMLRRSAGIMLLAVLAPELIVVWAARQWISARAFTHKMRECLSKVDQPEQGSMLAQKEQSSDRVVNARSSKDSRRTLISPTGDVSANDDPETRQENILSELTRDSGSSDKAPLLPVQDDISGLSTSVANFDAKDGTVPRRGSYESQSIGASHPPLGPLARCELPASNIRDLPGTQKQRPAWRRKVDSWICTNREDETWTITHSFYAYMGGFMVYHKGEPWRTITPLKLLDAVQTGKVRPIKLTKKEIADVSKGNFISKGLVVLQVTWFCVQLIARRGYGLAITPLEIGTMGFALLCCITYALWWNKPLNVGHPRRLEWMTGVPPDNLHEDRIRSEYRDPDIVKKARTLVGEAAGNFQLRVETLGGDDVEWIDSYWTAGWTEFKSQPAVILLRFVKDPCVIVCFIAASASTVFGLIHVAAWGLLFPTRVEEVIWEIGAILIVCIPVGTPVVIGIGLLLFPILGFDVSEKLPVAITAIILGLTFILATLDFLLIFVLLVCLPVVYVICRVTLIVIMFTSLRSLPPSSLETIPWAELIPHL